MKKFGNKSYWIGFLSGILFTFVGLFVAIWIDSRNNNVAEINELDAILGVATEDIKLWRRNSTATDKVSGNFCPQCKSTNVGRFLYGRYLQDTAIVEAVRSKRLIPGSCTLSEKSPKYRCNICSYEWGHVFINRFKSRDSK